MAINRKHNPGDALDTVKLAVHYKHTTAGTVLGIDLSGDPAVCKFVILSGVLLFQVKEID